MLSFFAKSGNAFSFKGSSNLILFNIIKADINLVAYLATTIVRFDNDLTCFDYFTTFNLLSDFADLFSKLKSELNQFFRAATGPYKVVPPNFFAPNAGII